MGSTPVSAASGASVALSDIADVAYVLSVDPATLAATPVGAVYRAQPKTLVSPPGAFPTGTGALPVVLIEEMGHIK